MLDFSTRWSLWFESPNHLGAWATGVFLLLLGILLLPQCQFKKDKWLPCSIVVLISYVISALFIAWSASRAAWIAVVVGVVIVGCCFPMKKVWGLLAIGIITIAIGIGSVDRVRDRAATVTEMGQDGSSQSRPRTWTAACRMIAVHPIAGIGSGNFSSLYTNWYEPEDRQDTLRTANNDMLHIMAENGFMIIAIVLMLYGLSFMLMMDAVRLQRPFLLCLSLACLSFFIHGLFNNVLTFMPLLPWVGVLVCTAIGMQCRLMNWRQFSKRFMLCLGISLGICLAIIGYGKYLINGDQTAMISRQGRLFVEPMRQAVRGHIIVSGEHDDRPRTLYRGVMQSLAEKGWQAELSLGNESFQELLNTIPSQSVLPTYIICLRNSGNYFLNQLAQDPTWRTKIHGAVLCDVDIPEALRIEQVPFPLMCVYGKLNTPTPPMTTSAFIAQLQMDESESLILGVTWGTTWARLIKRIGPEIGEWLDRVNN